MNWIHSKFIQLILLILSKKCPVLRTILFEELLPAQTSQTNQPTAKQQYGGGFGEGVTLYSHYSKTAVSQDSQ